MHREVHVYQPHLAVIFREHLVKRCFLLTAIWTLVVRVFDDRDRRVVTAEMPIGGGRSRALRARVRCGF